MTFARPLRPIAAAFAALALALAPLAAWAVATASVNVAADQWYDLGAGPAMIQGVNATVFWTVADSQPALSAPVSGTAYLTGVPVNTASHIWARTFPGFSSAVIVTPLTAAGGGGGGAAWIAKSLSRKTRLPRRTSRAGKPIGLISRAFELRIAACA